MMVVLNGLFGGLVDCLAYDGLSEVAPARTAGKATTGRARSRSLTLKLNKTMSDFSPLVLDARTQHLVLVT